MYGCAFIERALPKARRSGQSSEFEKTTNLGATISHRRSIVMGAAASFLHREPSAAPSVNVLFLGEGGAGKSTIIKQLKLTHGGKANLSPEDQDAEVNALIKSLISLVIGAERR